MTRPSVRLSVHVHISSYRIPIKLFFVFCTITNYIFVLRLCFAYNYKQMPSNNETKRNGKKGENDYKDTEAFSKIYENKFEKIETHMRATTRNISPSLLSYPQSPTQHEITPIETLSVSLSLSLSLFHLVLYVKTWSWRLQLPVANLCLTRSD